MKTYGLNIIFGVPKEEIILPGYIVVVGEEGWLLALNNRGERFYVESVSGKTYRLHPQLTIELKECADTYHPITVEAV